MKLKQLNMKLILILFSLVFSTNVFSQSIQKINAETQTQDKKYSYAYIIVEGRVFSKKFKVYADFGDTSEQIQLGKEYSEKLTDKESYAAILNYMAEDRYELVQTLDDGLVGARGKFGIVFIMRKISN